MKELCQCCRGYPCGDKEEQPYGMIVPVDDQPTRVPLCMICMIWVCQNVDWRMRNDHGSRPIHEAIKSVRIGFVNGSGSPRDWSPRGKEGVLIQ